MFCEQCGYTMSSDAVFCGSCGVRSRRGGAEDESSVDDDEDRGFARPRRGERPTTPSSGSQRGVDGVAGPPPQPGDRIHEPRPTSTGHPTKWPPAQPAKRWSDGPALPPLKKSSSFSTAAFVLGGLAVLIFPIILGPLGIVLGAVGKSKGEELAVASMIAALAGTIVGMWIGIVVWSL